MFDFPVLDVGAGVVNAVSLAAVANIKADGFAFVAAAIIGFLGELAHRCWLKEEGKRRRIGLGGFVGVDGRIFDCFGRKRRRRGGGGLSWTDNFGWCM